ncbi:MAG: hypothetical protein CMJ32_11800 [Phycisphaerae bacterium]|nr:hypothetical protein [Phycisphaerae bacterium]
MADRGNQHLESLLRQAASGDEDAWSQLVREYLPRVLALLRSQCHDADLAEEITQSTFCTIVTKLDGYNEVGRFESWLFRIAMNRLRDEMRRRGRQARPVEEASLVGLAGSTPDPNEDPDFTSEDFEPLRRAMAQLSESDRTVIDLRHQGGLSFKAISELLQEPVGTLLARHHRALGKLKSLIESSREPP